ncbi:LCP family protein [Dermacoccaceae bacterium W4C1]
MPHPPQDGEPKGTPAPRSLQARREHLSTSPGSARRQAPTDAAAESALQRQEQTRAERRTAQAENAHSARQAFGITALSGVLPGLGLAFTRKRRLGLLMVAVTLIILLATAFWAGSSGLSSAAQLLTAKGLLMLLGLVILCGLLWVLGVMLTAQETVRDSWSQRTVWGHRLFATALCAIVAMPAAAGTQYVLVTRDALGAITSDTDSGRADSTVDPVSGANAWKDIPRVNVLLIGSDAGEDRTNVRTDTLMVASINTKNGDTTLISIPRNLQKVPFPKTNPLYKKYPDGFDCGTECIMDAVWVEAEVNNKDLFPSSTKNPGWDTTVGVVSQIIGQPIDYSVVVDLDGFKRVVNAMGGVEIDVKQRLPMGGTVQGGYVNLSQVKRWLEPGKQKLDGEEALWYARSRATTNDEDRTRRQRCMINALVSQSDPFTLLRKFPEIMAVAKEKIRFNIPQDDLPAFASLVETMQKGNMHSVNLGKDAIDSWDPDFAKIRSLVKKAITTPQPKKKATASATASASTSTTSTTTSSAVPTIADTSSQC